MAITKDDITLKAGGAGGGNGGGAQAPAAPSRVTSVSALSLDGMAQVQVPAGAEEWRQAADRKVKAKVERYVADMDARHRDGDTESLGAPIVGTYNALDVLAYSPIQSITYPPYEPSRIIAGGEDAVIWALVFINPAVDVSQGFAIPATVQLGGRTLRVRLEQVNLTTVSDGPDQTFTMTLPSPAPSLIWVPFYFTADDPGENPALFEANITVDITDGAQPFAAFATYQVSVDAEPGFLWVPPDPGWQLLHNIPMRYLVFSQ
jgi:hypothetical protein